MRFVVALLVLLVASTAIASENTENYKKARDLLNVDAEKAHELAIVLEPFEHADEVRLSLLAASALRTQRVEEAIEHLAKYEAVTDNAKEKLRAKIERAELHALLGHSDDVNALVGRLRRDVRRVRMGRAERHFFRSRVYRLNHDLEENEKKQKSIAENLLINYPTEPATKRPGLSVKVEDLSDRERYRRANTLMNTWAYHEARSEFERLEKLGKYEHSASWNLGLIGLRKLRDRAEEAQKRFKALADAGKYEEAATWYWARALMKQNKYDEAFKVYERYEDRYPNGRHIRDIYYYRGWLPYDARENKKAIKGLKAFIDKYGKRSSKSTYIYGFLAWTYMREKQWKNAIGAWDDMMSFGNTLVEGKALYWKAVAQIELDQEEKALKTLGTLREDYSLSYYGMLGEQFRAKIEGTSQKASDVWWPEGGGGVNDQPTIDVAEFPLKLSKKDQEIWERVLELAELDEKHLAREAYEEIEDDVLRAVPRSKKTEFIHAVGWHIEDFNEMWDVSAGTIRAMPSFPTNDKLKMVMAYPRAYLGVVSDVSSEFDVPEEFIWSIMRQESRYKPSAISYTDAVGALQMIPKTARRVAADMGTIYNLRTFFRPEVGFRFSGFYMKQILEYFEGLFVPAAASYNTGPGVIARWFHKNPDLEFDHLIEEFEYNEGRAYCRKVTEHMIRYVWLYVEDEKERADLLNAMFPLSRDVTVPLEDEIPY